MAKMICRSEYTTFGPGGHTCPCCNPLRNVRTKWGHKRCPSKAKQHGRDVTRRQAKKREREALRYAIEKEIY